MTNRGKVLACAVAASCRSIGDFKSEKNEGEKTESSRWQRRATDGYDLKGNDTLSFLICSAVLPDRAVINN